MSPVYLRFWYRLSLLALFCGSLPSDASSHSSASPIVPPPTSTVLSPTGAIMRLGSGNLRHARGIGWLSFSKDGKSLLSGSPTDQIYVWRFPAGAVATSYAGYQGQLESCAFCPATCQLAVSGRGEPHNRILLWNA